MKTNFLLRLIALSELFICDIKTIKDLHPFSSLSKREVERVFSRALLQKSLNILYGFETMPEILFEQNGKPRFKEFSDIHFSLSHSGNFVAAAISENPCGVDIELKRQRSERFIGKIIENETVDADFYELWCLKEAYFKLKGTGDLRRSSGIYAENGKFFGPDGNSVGKLYNVVPGYALALFSSSAEPMPELSVISYEELIDAAVLMLDTSA